MSRRAPTTQLSLRLLRAKGWTAEVVERYVKTAQGGFLRDFFGFADILAVHPGFRGSLAVQTTTAAHSRERVSKICAEPRALVWVQAGNAIEVHGWHKEAGRWRVKILKVEMKT